MVKTGLFIKKKGVIITLELFFIMIFVIIFTQFGNIRNRLFQH